MTSFCFTFPLLPNPLKIPGFLENSVLLIPPVLIRPVLPMGLLVTGKMVSQGGFGLFWDSAVRCGLIFRKSCVKPWVGRSDPCGFLPSRDVVCFCDSPGLAWKEWPCSPFGSCEGGHAAAVVRGHTASGGSTEEGGGAFLWSQLALSSITTTLGWPLSHRQVTLLRRCLLWVHQDHCPKKSWAAGV